MARDTAILLGEKAWMTGNPTASLNPAQGGQFAYATEPAEWLSAQAHVPRNIIPIVLEVPTFFNSMPEPEYWKQAWRVFFEKHARTIEGLKAGLTVDVGEHAFGGAGEMFQEFLDVKRERSNLSISLTEKYGNVWQNYWEDVITFGMMDPESKTPLTATLEGQPIDDNLADRYSGIVAFIQPDHSGVRCHRCWIGANIWPHGNGGIEGKLDRTSALSIKELSMEFSIIAFTGNGPRVMGQQLLDGIIKTWANPQNRKSFISEIAPDVVALTKGFNQNVTDLAAQRAGDLI